jgi:hypothetical protein
VFAQETIPKAKAQIKEDPNTNESCLSPEKGEDCPAPKSHEEKQKEEAVEIGPYTKKPNAKDYEYQYPIPKSDENSQ